MAVADEENSKGIMLAKFVQRGNYKAVYQYGFNADGTATSVQGTKLYPLIAQDTRYDVHDWSTINSLQDWWNEANRQGDIDDMTTGIMDVDEAIRQLRATTGVSYTKEENPIWYDAYDTYMACEDIESGNIGQNVIFKNGGRIYEGGQGYFNIIVPARVIPSGGSIIETWIDNEGFIDETTSTASTIDAWKERFASEIAAKLSESGFTLTARVLEFEEVTSASAITPYLGVI